MADAPSNAAVVEDDWQRPAGAESPGRRVILAVAFALVAVVAAWFGGRLLWDFWRIGLARNDVAEWQMAGLGLFVLLLAVGLAYAALAVLAPSVEVILPPGPYQPGKHYPIRYRFVGRGVGWLSRVRVVATCVETFTVDETDFFTEAGKRDVRTESHVLARLELAELQSVERGDLAEGMAMLKLPPNARPSVASGRGSTAKASRSVSWRLDIVGAIRFWPDAGASFGFDVDRGEAAHARRAKARRFGGDRLPRRGTMR